MNRHEGRHGGHNQVLQASEQGALRTPIAWQQRNNMNLQHQHHQQGMYPERYGMGELGPDPNQYNSISMAGEHYEMDVGHVGHARVMSAGSRSARARSSANNHLQSASHGTDTTSSTSSEEHDFDSRSQYQLNHDARQAAHQAKAAGMHCAMHSTTGSTWDGEPCPIHHLALQMQPMLIPMMPPSYPQSNNIMLLPPMLRPRPLVQPADIPAPPEPLPVRVPSVALPQKENDTIVVSKPIRCCKGHIIVLWIILSIILTGILLGVTLRFVIP